MYAKTFGLLTWWVRMDDSVAMFSPWFSISDFAQQSHAKTLQQDNDFEPHFMRINWNHHTEHSL